MTVDPKGGMTPKGNPMGMITTRDGTGIFYKPKFPPSHLADAFDQVVEPLITEIT